VVSAFTVLKRRIASGTVRHPPVTGIVKQASADGHGVIISRFGWVPAPGAKVPAAHQYIGTPIPASRAAGGPGWQVAVPHGGPAFHGQPTGGGLSGGLLVPLALLLLTLGLWLVPRSAAALRAHSAGLRSYLRQRMLENRWGILLIPVALLGLTVFGVQLWTVAAVLVCVVTAVRWPLIAADMVPLALAAFAVRGFMIAASWQSLQPGSERFGQLYGIILVRGAESAMLAGAEASAFLVVAAWLVPRTIGAHARGILIPGRDLELEGRVQRLTETRDLAVDAAATELRRIERDLHDGAQARLVALGMNLRAVERMLPGRPDAALALVAEARETSLRALNDLRDLVRGICPPVLADRGLGHAVRALALDTPFPVDLDIDLPGRLSAPVETACYFAVAEALANAVRHSGARRVHIRIQHTGGLLRVQVADDGAGGADPARGTGLRGVEQRLAAFDGILAVSSPPGGPTMIAMEVPCALSSPKTCSC
jgi:signal transduction histidine kinase